MKLREDCGVGLEYVTVSRNEYIEEEFIEWSNF